MRTSLYLILALFILTATTSLAQDYKENVRKSFGEFYGLTAAGKIEESMEYIPEALFSFVPKDKMAGALKQVMNNKDLDYKILDYNITSMGDSKMVDKNYYVVFRYVSNLKMKFNNLDTIKKDDTKMLKLNLAKMALANTFGSDNVKLDEATGVYLISAHKKSCAISPNGQTNWKFINFEPRQRLLMEKVLPKEILEEL